MRSSSCDIKMSSRLPSRVLNLRQFLLRSEVLSLYRSILRALRKVPDEQHKKELLQWARNDFKKNKHHTDEEVIKMMMSQGRMTLKEVSAALQLAR